jgi:hypothetical protein
MRVTPSPVPGPPAAQAESASAGGLPIMAYCPAPRQPQAGPAGGLSLRKTDDDSPCSRDARGTSGAVDFTLIRNVCFFFSLLRGIYTAKAFRSSDRYPRSLLGPARGDPGRPERRRAGDRLPSQHELHWWPRRAGDRLPRLHERRRRRRWVGDCLPRLHKRRPRRRRVWDHLPRLHKRRRRRRRVWDRLPRLHERRRRRRADAINGGSGARHMTLDYVHLPRLAVAKAGMCCLERCARDARGTSGAVDFTSIRNVGCFFSLLRWIYTAKAFRSSDRYPRSLLGPARGDPGRFRKL